MRKPFLSTTLREKPKPVRPRSAHALARSATPDQALPAWLPSSPPCALSLIDSMEGFMPRLRAAVKREAAENGLFDDDAYACGKVAPWVKTVAVAVAKGERANLPPPTGMTTDADLASVAKAIVRFFVASFRSTTTRKDQTSKQGMRSATATGFAVTVLRRMQTVPAAAASRRRSKRERGAQTPQTTMRGCEKHVPLRPLAKAAALSMTACVQSAPPHVKPYSPVSVGALCPLVYVGSQSPRSLRLSTPQERSETPKQSATKTTTPPG